LRPDGDSGRLGSAHGQGVVADPKLDRISERRHADDSDPGTGQKAHLHEAPREAALAVDRRNFGMLADRQIEERPLHRVLIMNFFIEGNRLEIPPNSL
jgi:hypothetical protein